MDIHHNHFLTFIFRYRDVHVMYMHILSASYHHQLYLCLVWVTSMQHKLNSTWHTLKSLPNNTLSRMSVTFAAPNFSSPPVCHSLQYILLQGNHFYTFLIIKILPSYLFMETKFYHTIKTRIYLLCFKKEAKINMHLGWF